MDDSLPATPCGLVAKSVFNDTFTLKKVEDDGSTPEIEIIQKDIAWDSDIAYKFKRIPTEDLPGD